MKDKIFFMIATIAAVKSLSITPRSMSLFNTVITILGGIALAAMANLAVKE